MPRIVSRVPLPSRGLDLTVVTVAAPAEKRAAAKGPVVVVSANIHGDETTGVGAVLRLLGLLEHRLTRGTVHLYPSLNPEGLERRARKVPEDDQDLNRLFPGDAQGSPSERLAYAIWTELGARHPDALIDLHADAPASIPYTLIDRPTGLRPMHREPLLTHTRALADATGLTVLHEYPEDRYARYRLDRSLTGAVLNRLQVPALTIEAGPRLYLDPRAVDTAVDGVLGVLAALDMVPEASAAHATRVGGGPWRRDAGPRASVSGVLFPRVPPGVLLAPGAIVAEVRSLAGAVVEELAAETPGFVVSHAERAHVVAGVPVCTWAMSEP